MTRRLGVAAVIALGHFALLYLALRTLVGGATGAHAPPAWSAVAVAVLGAPLYYTPLPSRLGDGVGSGLPVAALNSLLWGLAAYAFLAWRARRRRSRG